MLLALAMITWSYGPAPQQHAELRLPAGRGPFPVVVLIHGGCWIHYADAQYTSKIAAALTEPSAFTGQGWATWNLEYRRAHEPGGGWPGTFRDVEAGVAALRDAAKQHPLDLSRVVVMGHSAGGQLALYVGKRKPLPLRGIVSLGGIADMKIYAEKGPSGCAEGTPKVMGGRPDQVPERYAEVSPAELLPLGLPQVLIWGDKDTIVPERFFEAYEKRAQSAGDPVEIIRIPNAAHHELCNLDHPGWQQTLAALRRLLH